MTPPTNLVGAAILLLLALPIWIAVLVCIFEDSPPTIGWLLAQAFLMLAATMTIGGLSLFLLLKAADYPKETPNVQIEARHALVASLSNAGLGIVERKPCFVQNVKLNLKGDNFL